MRSLGTCGRGSNRAEVVVVCITNEEIGRLRFRGMTVRQGEQNDEQRNYFKKISREIVPKETVLSATCSLGKKDQADPRSGRCRVPYSAVSHLLRGTLHSRAAFHVVHIHYSNLTDSTC